MSRLKESVARPYDPGTAAGVTYGSYSFGAMSGVIAATPVTGELFQFRWNAGATLRAIIHRITISVAVSTTYFAAGVPLQIGLFKSSAWTAAGSGGTAITLGAFGKRRSTFGSSLVAAGDMRIATTGALGAGTKTKETNAMANVISGAPITASLSGQVFPPGTVLFDGRVHAAEYPLVLENQEGFTIDSIACPATGTWSIAVCVDWTEDSVYPNA